MLYLFVTHHEHKILLIKATLTSFYN